MNFSKQLSWIFVILSMLFLVVGCNSTSSNGESSVAKENAGKSSESGEETTINFPERDLNGIIQWGEGGATDIISRTIAPLAEEYLGKSIIMTNRTGASGAIAAQYVNDQKPDGHNLLFSTEGQALFNVLGISKLGYDDFYPVSILGRTVSVVAVKADSSYETLEDLLQSAEENPGEVKIGSSGPGSNSHIMATIFSQERGLKFNMVPFDGSGPALTAMLGDHVDVTILNVIDAVEYVKSGDIRILTVFNDTKVEQFPDVPPIVKIDPAYEKYLGWTEFFAVVVKKDTPDEIKATLVEAFRKAFEKEEFQDRLSQYAIIPMGIHGDEADIFIDRFQSVTAWLLYDAGELDISPEEFDIPRIK